MRSLLLLVVVAGCLGPPAPDRDLSGSAPADLPGAPTEAFPDAFAPVGGEKESDDGGSGLGKDGWAKVEAQWRCLGLVPALAGDAAELVRRRHALVASYGVTADWLAQTREENGRDADFARKVNELVAGRMERDCPGGRPNTDLRTRAGLL